MPTYRAQVVIPYFTNFPEDVITNTFHFVDFVPQPMEDLADDVTPLISDMYDAIYTATDSGANYVAWNLARVQWYDLSQPEPRSPYILPMPIATAPSATQIPTEVACVMSFQAPPVSGIPQSRRRGRVYLGGLGSGWFSPSISTAYPRFSTGKSTVVANAMEAFHTAVNGTSARWAVWSPTDQAAYLVENGWVENSPDTQRRRSVESTIRVLWP
jgi:hypothetical protein